MNAYQAIFDRFVKKSPFAVLVRSVLQRLLPCEQLNKLFDKAADKQYQRTLFFSHLMTLMMEVVLKSSPSVNHSYKLHQDETPVSVTSVYNKLNGLEPNISRELVKYSVQQFQPTLDILHKNTKPALDGLEIRLIDGNHFSGTQHRLIGTRNHQAAPLPGQALAILDPRLRMIVDVIPNEDGHAQERSMFDQVAELVKENELWIADRNFATLELMFDVASVGFFLMRQHGSLTTWITQTKEKYVGKTVTGKVYEQRILLTHPKTGGTMKVRRIRLALFQPTEDGDTDIYLLTNLTRKQANSKKCCELYRTRWGIEEAFLEWTTCLSCEIETLAYPRAAIFAFCLACMLYNAVSLVKGALSYVHGEEAVENLSWYYVYTQTHQVWTGMEIALPYEHWDDLVGAMSHEAFASYLIDLSRKIEIEKYQKSVRGPKKTVKKKYDAKVNHVSTFKILQERKTPEKQAPK